MRRSRRLSCAALLAVVMALSLGVTSCGGGGGGGGDSDLVLLGFNVPNIAGIPLNHPLIFTFSNDIDPSSITPDTLRVVGALGPNFETTVIDGNLVALLPRSPNFEDYSDSGLLPGIQYTVSFAQYPAPSTIRTPDGKPLLEAASFQFTTVPAPEFVEPRRPIRHGLPPSAGGTSDDEGCLNNSENTLDTTKQFGSGIGARLLCLKNEGAPQIIQDECVPTHNDLSVGSPSAVTPGFVNLPALRVRLNEPLDPISVVPYVPTDKLGLNVQLWLVGDTDRVPLPPRQVRTNKPLLVQSLTQTEIILVAANEDAEGQPVGGVPQGTYLVNVTGAVRDLPGNPLDTSTRPNPAIGGFQDVEDAVNASGDVPPGYRYYFVTLVVPGTPQSIVENYANQLNEWGDAASGSDEPGLYSRTDLQDPLDPGDDIVMYPINGFPVDDKLEQTLIATRDGCGQSTTANWNNGFRFWGISTLAVNADIDDGGGALKAVYQPYCGDGQDGVFSTPGGGTVVGLSTDPGGSIDGDGIYEFESFALAAGDTLNVTGSQPLVILCRGDFTLNGTVNLQGSEGGPGLDTDGDVLYEHPDSIAAGGPGGAAGPGGGDGGAGGSPLGATGGVGSDGSPFTSVFGQGSVDGGGAGYADPQGGGGGGLVSPGDDGTFDDGSPAGNGGAIAADGRLTRPVSSFGPDRCYSPNAEGSGGTGGGGGGLEDSNSNGIVENGDAGGGGGGGAGGGLYVIAKGVVTIAGTINASGGDGGSTFAEADQIIDLGADAAPGGTGEDADTVIGIVPGANPSGAGGPGGGGSGGAVFFVGGGGCTVTGTATIDCGAGAGGLSGDPDLVGGNGAEGVILVGSIDGAAVTVDVAANVTPTTPTVFDYEPTVDYVSVGQSEWFDVFTPTGKFEVFRWTSNFDDLQSAGLVQGVDFDAILEIQGTDTLSPLPQDGAPTTATNAIHWTQINSNLVSEDRVEYPGGGSPIDGKRFFRYRWRFRVKPGWPTDTQPLPQILSTTIEFER